MQRQHGVFVTEMVIRQRLAHLGLLAVDRRIGEVVILLQRLDIDLGQRRQLLAGELALHLALIALRGEGGKHVVEGPVVPDSGDRAVGRKHDFGMHRHPDMRMRLSRHGEGQAERGGNEGQDRGFHGRHIITDCGIKEARNIITTTLRLRRWLNAGRAAIGARVVAALHRTIRMKYNGAGVPHRIGIALVQDRDVVPGRHQPVDQMAVETGFHP